jgi:hypothetical protein
MPVLSATTVVRNGLSPFVRSIGQKRWCQRLEAIRSLCVPGHTGRAARMQHALELTLDRLWRTCAAPETEAERKLSELAGDLAALMAALPEAGQARLRTRIEAGLSGSCTLVPLFHLLRCARLYRARGFEVEFSGLADATGFDLKLTRDGQAFEAVCDTLSAEDGRDVHRTAWSYLVDRVDPDLQSWLTSHPGRYVLKMTLPAGLRGEEAGGDSATLAALHARITRLLTESRRADHDEAAVLRLEPLMLAGAQASELGLMAGLRREFGHEAHLAVTAAGRGVLVMAARAARQDEVPQAMQRRMMEIAPMRLSGTRPAILAMFIEDTDQHEWRVLRDQLQLEGAARHFLTRPEARRVAAVTCASRFELLGAAPPHAAEGGELRFRSPGYREAGPRPFI